MTPAILTDLTKCIGCEACALACKEVNGLPDRGSRSTLSADTWTAVAPQDLAANVAAVAAFIYAIADSPETLPHP